jgi:hypothetical protein
MYIPRQLCAKSVITGHYLIKVPASYIIMTYLVPILCVPAIKVEPL